MSRGVLSNGIEYEEVIGEETKNLDRYFTYTDGALKIGEEKWIFPKSLLKMQDKMYSFNYTHEDVTVGSFPKSGTTWAQEIVWSLMFDPNSDHPMRSEGMDFRSSNLGDLFLMISASPKIPEDHPIMIETRRVCPDYKDGDPPILSRWRNMSSPRICKNHFPFPLFHKDTYQKGKVIYVARHYKDTFISNYYFMKLAVQYHFSGTMDELVDSFIADEVIFSPYWLHLKRAWEMRNHPNFLFLFFEDLKSDPMKEIRKINSFLGLKRTEEQLENVRIATSFQNLKNRIKDDVGSAGGAFYRKDVKEKYGGYYRKGQSGGGEELSESANAKLNEWARKNLDDFDDDFKYKHMIN